MGALQAATVTRSVACLFGVLLLGGCASVTNTRVSQPATPSVDVSSFRRVWIAGFVTSANGDIDLNDETVRLLRSQLTSRTLLRVIDAEPLTIDGESMLRNEERWRSLAEEYGAPLIVTGSVRLVSARPVSTERTSGRRSVYVLRKGFVLEATFVFIDGRTGEVVASQSLPKEKLYGADDRASTLSLYFQLMDRVLPVFLRAFDEESVLAARSSWWNSFVETNLSRHRGHPTFMSMIDSRTFGRQVLHEPGVRTIEPPFFVGLPLAEQCASGTAAASNLGWAFRWPCLRDAATDARPATNPHGT